MIPALAQSASSSSNADLGQWVLVAGSVAAIVLVLLQIYRIVFPHPPEWQAHVEAARRAANEGDEAIRRELKEESTQLHGRVSGLRNEIRADLEKSAAAAQSAADKTEAAVSEAVKTMLATNASLSRDIGTIGGKLDANIQATNATREQVQRHIERSSV